MSAPTKQRESSLSEEPGVLSELRLRPLRIAKATAAVVTFAATTTGLVFGLWPALTPTGPPATKRATFSNVTVDQISFVQYLDRASLSRSPYGPAQLGRRGALVVFDVNVKGLVNKQLPLQWRLLDARTGDQVAHARDFFYVPRAGDDRNSLPIIWVQIPRGSDRRFFVEVQLLDDRGRTPLARIRTNRFSGT